MWVWGVIIYWLIGGFFSYWFLPVSWVAYIKGRASASTKACILLAIVLWPFYFVVFFGDKLVAYIAKERGCK